MIRELRRQITKKLTCPACGAIIADATYRRWPSDLVLISVDGHLVQPIGVALQIRLAEQEIAAGAADHAGDRAPDALLARIVANPHLIPLPRVIELVEITGPASRTPESPWSRQARPPGGPARHPGAGSPRRGLDRLDHPGG